jgi:hypothetical protein
MNPWLFVWILASGASIVVLCIFLASMGSELLQLTRAARRFQEEVGGLAADISRGQRRASERVSSLPTPGKRRSD